MTKKKTTRRAEVDSADRVRSSKTTRREEPAGDFMEVGKEVVPGMRLRCICRGHTGTIGRIAWSPCGRFIASPSKDKTIRIWDANDGTLRLTLEELGQTAFAVCWLDSPNRILASVGKTIRVWLLDGLEASEIDPLVGHNNFVYTIAASVDGQTLATGSADGTIRRWDLMSSECTHVSDSRLGVVRSVAWSPNGLWLAAGGVSSVLLGWNAEDFSSPKAFRIADFKSRSFGVDPGVSSVVWTADGQHLVVAADDGRIRVWNWESGELKNILEGHTDSIISVAASEESGLLVSKSTDNTIHVWRVDTWERLGKARELSAGPFQWTGSVAFGHVGCALASLAEYDKTLRIWDFDSASDFSDASGLDTVVRYTSAKIVLVGESNVGKSCLAMRLAEDRYPEDHEHGTTHGMRFWPMEAEELHPAATPPKGQRRDVVLWDFGGQDEYRLVHQMFLHDTTLALVLIDPTRGRAAMDEARDWNMRLERHLGKDRAVKLLVGAKVDRKSEIIDFNEISNLMKECGFAAFLDLSAKTGRNTRRLRKLISDALDWEQMAKTSRPELFQHIRDEIELRRRSGEIAVTLEDFELELMSDDSKEIFNLLEHEVAMASDAFAGTRAIRAVSVQLATQGIVVRTQLMSGDEALVLQLPVIERYAGSLIIAARNNPRGVPVLEERLLGSTKTIPLPGMTKKERLNPAKERMVLECIVELMIQHGICFRHGGLLVLPTLFPAGGADDEKLPHSVSLYYDFTGAIDNIYASLVSKLMVGEAFGEGRLEAGRVEFDRPGEGLCGIRQIKQQGGFAHVDLFFAEGTTSDRRDLFTRFVEEHLRANGVDIREHQAIKCRGCGETIEERIVQANIAAGEKDVICSVCRTHTLITEGVKQIRKRDPESDQKILALRKSIEERTARDVAIAKSRVSHDATLPKGEPIRVLHLSDLHFTKDTSPQRHLVPLLQDIRNGDFLGFDSVEYLVVSGDMTDKGGDAGFDKAREFVEALIEELGLSAQRCILLPGNHDVQDVAEAHQEVEPAGGGAKVMARHPENYKKRFLSFSQAFYHKVVQQPYPLEFGEQGMSYLFPNNGVQFFALNSAWQVDKFGRDNSGIHPDAVAGVMRRANNEIERAVESGDLKKNQRVLRIAVWHHALEGKWAMQNDEFLENLQSADVKLCLHGDVHESRRKLVNWWKRGGVYIVGAGTFGSPEPGRPESTPRLYNLLEIRADLKSVRVHTREQRKAEGAWRGWHEWPDPDGGKGQVPYFDINLTGN